MNLIKLLPAVAFALTPALAFVPLPVLAANADAPYTNVDHSNDMGNNTGDSKVEGLNRGQLNENYHGPLQMRTPSNVPGPGVPTGPAPLAPPSSR
jgi:hypothetical protein